MFSEVLNKITPFMAVTLRWLAGASYLDLCFSFGIVSATFYHPNGVLWFTLLAINAALKMGLLVDDIGKLEMLSSRGYKHSGEILDGCVIALDGFGVAT
jgi:hypothetical protein